MTIEGDNYELITPLEYSKNNLLRLITESLIHVSVSSTNTNITFLANLKHLVYIARSHQISLLQHALLVSPPQLAYSSLHCL